MSCKDGDTIHSISTEQDKGRQEVKLITTTEHGEKED